MRFAGADAALVHRLADALAVYAATPPGTPEIDAVAHGPLELARLHTPPSTGAVTDGSLVHSFAEVVAAHPDRPAVTHRDATWTYRELAAAADGVAVHLAASGVEPGHRVGLSVAPGRDAVAGVLGILMATMMALMGAFVGNLLRADQPKLPKRRSRRPKVA